MGSSPSTASKHPLGQGPQADARIEGGDTRRRGLLPPGQRAWGSDDYPVSLKRTSYRPIVVTAAKGPTGILQDFAASEAATGGSSPPPGPPLASLCFRVRKKRQKPSSPLDPCGLTVLQLGGPLRYLL